ncbi:MAG: glutamate racemase [Nitrospirae bacterium]|nr:MAG: glutamate racemase [Nitrospirota bacterium]
MSRISPEAAIGVFDSGVGGLTVMREMMRLMPGEDLIYLGDTARVPYGIRSEETVRRYARENASFLLEQNIKMIVVACNTVSAVGLDVIRELTSVPVVGVLTPGAQAAVRATRKGRIAVIGTEATISSSAYQRAIKKLDSSVEVITRACPLFVPLVEEGWLDGEIVEGIVKRYLDDLKNIEIDTLVLGCTHYPLLKGTIGRVMGKGVRLIDSAIETASAVKDLLNRMGLLREGRAQEGRRIYFVTDSADRFKRIGTRFLGREMEEIEKVEIGSKA